MMMGPYWYKVFGGQSDYFTQRIEFGIKN